MNDVKNAAPKYNVVFSYCQIFLQDFDIWEYELLFQESEF